jgi:hypothetical protein
MQRSGDVTVRRPAMTLLTAMLLLAFAGTLPAAATHELDDEYHAFANEHYETRWARTDRPVSDLTVSRTWMWGPGPYTPGIPEEYVDAQGGERIVQYFDKSRMEINHDPAIAPGNVWYVTNGLLVVEMVSGWYQIGDDEFDLTPDPSEEFIAGDPDAAHGIRYADIDALGLRERPAALPGTTLSQAITHDGTIVGGQEWAQYGVRAEHRVTVDGIDHTVADVFWDFMTSRGPVWVDGETFTDDLFINPFYATGYPITEAYWGEFTVAGVPQPVLWQCFERRCLTYTPGNATGWQVEAGNVGQHYYRWRYGDQVETETATIYLVMQGEALSLSPTFGCDDVLVPVEVDVVKRDTVEGRVVAAINRLVGYQHPTLANALRNANLSIQSVTVSGNTTTVNLTGSLSLGGACDEPRVVEQLTATVRGVTGTAQVVFTRNGGPLIPPGAALEGGIVATFAVSGEQFNVWVTNPETIAAILRLQAGEQVGNIPNGLIHRGPGAGNHNAPYSWHLDPDEIVMSEATIELCDGRPSYVEAHVDEFVNTIRRYCPWQAELVGVVDYR